MMGQDLFPILLTASCYLPFNDVFFRFCGDIKGEKATGLSRVLSFLLIYGWFVIAGTLELPLVVNWSVFLLILGFLVYRLFSFDFIESYTLSLFCVIMGLLVNIFFRSFASIILNKPLSQFDSSRYNLKVYPIALGFLVMVVILQIVRKKRVLERIKIMLQYRESLNFYFRTEICIFIFINSQLLLYSQTTNELGVKLWGIKASLFCGIVLIVTIIYALRVALLHYYVQRRYDNRSQFLRNKEDTNRLWTLAHTDMLTGCNNRHLLDKRLEEYAGYGGSITLGFIDINGLKVVNDQHGHIEGDIYLKKVAEILIGLCKECKADVFRYGGDEFVVMSNTLSEEKITDTLKKANEMLKEESKEFFYSISYGVVHGESGDYKKLIREADEKMYHYKSSHYGAKSSNQPGK